MSKFGIRVRELRRAKGYSLRELAPLVGVGFTYLSKIENGKLDFGDSPSAELIGRLASTLEVDSSELLMLAGRIPGQVRDRILEKPEIFRRFAALSDRELERVFEYSVKTSSRAQK
ncbi:helix-turn-helix domain-containing protein [Roseiconus lacunae]|uniref:helix-turn-helix domain-containing protein n=1 Tax=Roseiconus lacunae TaxID=2605694 RepID=UPI001E52404A|nr:helix-turn-helix transcriptional regulator [Roseiconus lacunae]MCD0458620.1 helix-turn-helix transcriptional regulator [Roseiconus lacunae]